MAISIESSSQVHSTTGITSSSVALQENLNRRDIIIQNLGTNTLYIKFGENATTTDFNLILKGGDANNDGNGGVVSYSNLSYTGVISVAGTSPRYVATDF